MQGIELVTIKEVERTKVHIIKRSLFADYFIVHGREKSNQIYIKLGHYVKADTCIFCPQRTIFRIVFVVSSCSFCYGILAVLAGSR